MLLSHHLPLTWQFLNSVVSELFYYLTLDSFVVHYTRFFPSVYIISSLTPYMSVHACCTPHT